MMHIKWRFADEMEAYQAAAIVSHYAISRVLGTAVLLSFDPRVTGVINALMAELGADCTEQLTAFDFECIAHMTEDCHDED